MKYTVPCSSFLEIILPLFFKIKKENGMINNKILTICIPTYNRPKKLNNQLKVLLPQLNNEVKLIVRDNHSNYNIKKRTKYRFNNRNLNGFKNL